MASMAQASECNHWYEVPSGAQGRLRKHCSKACSSKASYERRKGAINATKAELNRVARGSVSRACPQCGTAFTPENTLAQRFCSRRCNVAAHRDSTKKQCGEPGCTNPLRARGMCAMHWRRWARAEGREVSPAWDDRRRGNYQKRRALKRNLPADDIRPADVYERDGWICGICDDHVDRTLKYPDPKSPSLDHVIPLSKGGHHVMENTQLAHLDCNVRKGDRESVAA